MISRYSRPEMAQLWTDDAKYQLWLDVEILVLEQLVKLGLAPATALENVRKRASFSANRILGIENEARHDVIAFLTNVAESVGEDARYLHLGMTSSDLLDTVFGVQLSRATDLILAAIETLLESIKKQAFAYKKTVCVGRSHGIHAEPMTFGLKFAVWYAEVSRHKRRIQFAREDIAVGAISGAVGTYAHLSPMVEEHVCKVLGLQPAPASTQIIQRDRHAALFSAYAQLGGTLEKICLEIRHLQRTEVREAEEYFSKGQKGSSAMPHKRNPILSENVTGLARLLRSWAAASLENIPLWHERDISHSSVERIMAPDMTITLDFMLARVSSIVKNLVVYPKNMQKNLELTRGLVFSGTLLVELAKKGLSREDAYQLVQKHALDTWEEINSEASLPLSCPSRQAFEERVRADQKITSILKKEELDSVFSLEKHLEHVDFIFQRVFRLKI